MNSKMIASVCLGVGMSLLAVSGCRKNQEPEYPPPQPSATQTAYPTATATATETAPPATEAPAVEPPAATPLDQLSLDELAKGIKKRVAKHAPYPMKALDVPFGATLAAGQSFEHQIMITGQKCYSVIAQGGPGITDLDIEIQIQPIAGAPARTPFAVDSTSGPEAAITPCVQNVLPAGFVGFVVIKATGGSGPVAAQVFMK